MASRYAEEITGSTHGRGIALTMTVQVFENGHCRSTASPAASPARMAGTARTNMSRCGSASSTGSWAG
jgi:hypothetical protein